MTAASTRPHVEREPTCYGYCGSLGWTIEHHGRVTHKQSCPHRAEPWCQSHPDGCPAECEPVMWKERAAKERLEREWGDRYEQDAKDEAENPPGFVGSDEDERPVYQLYTARETAENLGVSERTIRRWIEGLRLFVENHGC